MDRAIGWLRCLWNWQSEWNGEQQRIRRYRIYIYMRDVVFYMHNVALQVAPRGQHRQGTRLPPTNPRSYCSSSRRMVGQWIGSSDRKRGKWDFGGLTSTTTTIFYFNLTYTVPHIARITIGRTLQYGLLFGGVIWSNLKLRLFIFSGQPTAIEDPTFPFEQCLVFNVRCLILLLFWWFWMYPLDAFPWIQFVHLQDVAVGS